MGRPGVVNQPLTPVRKASTPPTSRTLGRSAVVFAITSTMSDMARLPYAYDLRRLRNESRSAASPMTPLTAASTAAGLAYVSEPSRTGSYALPTDGLTIGSSSTQRDREIGPSCDLCRIPSGGCTYRRSTAAMGRDGGRGVEGSGGGGGGGEGGRGTGEAGGGEGLEGEPSGFAGDEGGGRGAVRGGLGVVGGGGEEGANGEGGAKVVVSGDRCAERTKAAQSISR